MRTFKSLSLLAAALSILATSAHAVDLNGDGMQDEWQQRYQIAPFSGSANPDGDARINLVESINRSDPGNGTDFTPGSVYITDVNGDFLEDHWQAQYNIPSSALLDDPDQDYRTNWEESIVGSNPHLIDHPWRAAWSAPDVIGTLTEFSIAIPQTIPGLRYRLQSCTDMESWAPSTLPGTVFWGNGMPRTFAIPTLGAARCFYRFVIDQPDTDGDLLDDWAELQLGTNANNPDTDGDGVNDGDEYSQGYDPNDNGSTPDMAPNTAPGEDGPSELPVTFLYQYKQVSEHWSQFGLEAPVGSISWADMDGHSGAESTQDPLAWQGKLDLMAWPEGPHDERPWNTVMSDTRAVGSQFISTTSLLSVHNTSLSHLHLVLRVASSAPEDKQPWSVTRRYLKIKSTLQTGGGVPPVNESQGFQAFTIAKNARYSNTTILEPELYNMHEVRMLFSPVEFNPNLASNGLDVEIHPPWLMIPEGGESSLQVRTAATSSIPIWFKTGDGDTPLTQTGNSQHTYLTFPAEEVSEYLDVSVDGENYETNDPVLRFVKYPRRTLKVSLHPVTLLSTSGAILAAPQDAPIAEELQDYLDYVLGLQANIFTEVTVKPTVSVNWDVGLGGGAEFVNPQAGRADGNFDTCVNSDNLNFGDEAAAIKALAHDATADVNIYYLAMPATTQGIWVYTRWISATDRARKEYYAAGLGIGFAGNAHRDNEGMIWVYEYAHDSPISPNRTLPNERKWAIAHEICHYIGDLEYHSTDRRTDNPSYRRNTDNERRLMMGRECPKRYDSPTTLIKEEWDELQLNIDKIR